MDQETKKQFKKVDERFDELLTTIKDGFDDLSGRSDKVEGRLERVEGEIKIIKSTMVTKDYLDNKLSDLGAEIGRRINAAAEKERAFHTKLITIFKRNKILQPTDIKELERMLAH